MSEELILNALKGLDIEENQVLARLADIQAQKERYKSALTVFRELSPLPPITEFSMWLSKTGLGKLTVADAVYSVLNDSNGMNKSEIISAIKRKHNMDVKSSTLSVTMQRMDEIKFIGDKWYYRPQQNETATTPSEQDVAASNMETTNKGGLDD